MGWQGRAVILGLVLGVGALFVWAGQVTPQGPDDKMAAVIKRVEPLEAVFLAKVHVVRCEIVQQRIVESYEARKLLERSRVVKSSNAEDRLMQLQMMEDLFLQEYEGLWQEAASLCAGHGRMDANQRMAKRKNLELRMEMLKAKYERKLAKISQNS